MLAVISSRYQYGPFLFFVAEVNMSNYLTTDGLEKIFSTSGGPTRPEARGICHICHMVNPAALIPHAVLLSTLDTFIPANLLAGAGETKPNTTQKNKAI